MNLNERQFQMLLSNIQSLIESLVSGDIAMIAAVSLVVTFSVVVVMFYSMMFGRVAVQEACIKVAIEYYLPSKPEITFKIFDCESVTVRLTK